MNRGNHFASLAPQVLICLLSICLVNLPDVSAQWGNWRGPNHDGVSAALNLPDTWNETENVLWKLTLPAPGSSTPAIIGDKILLTVEVGGTVQLLCISTKGKELWRRKVCDTRKGSNNNGEKTHASPSPSADSHKIFVMTGTGEVVSYDFAGREQWRFNAQERYGRFKLGFGYHTTPVLHEGRLYLQLINTAYQIVACADGLTGKELLQINI